MFSLLVRLAWEENMKKEKNTTASRDDYLAAILVLQQKKGMGRSVDVAQHLGVKKPSVCNAVSILEQCGFLVKDEDHFLHLTEKGRKTAETIYERHCYFKNWLVEAGVADATAEQDACRIEQVIREQSFQKMKRWKVLGHTEETTGACIPRGAGGGDRLSDDKTPDTGRGKGLHGAAADPISGIFPGYAPA